MRLIKDEMWHLAALKIKYVVALGIVLVIVNLSLILSMKKPVPIETLSQWEYHFLGIINFFRLFGQKANVTIFAAVVSYLLTKLFFPSFSFTDLMRKDMTLEESNKFKGACILVGLFMLAIIYGFTHGL